MNAWTRASVDCCERYFLIRRILKNEGAQIFVICVAMDSLESNQDPRFLAIGTV